MRALVLALVLPSAPALGASFAPLGDLPGGPFDSVAYGISPDGTTVVGVSRIEFSDNPEAFRWTAADGMVGLGFLPNGGTYTFGTAASSDGSVVIGYGNDQAPGFSAFRWTASGGVADLGDPPGGGAASSVVAYGVSADGDTVVGSASRVAGVDPPQAFRWTPARGISYLVDPATGPLGSVAHSISGDSTAIVGYSFTDYGQGIEAFRWTAATGLLGLGDLPGGGQRSEAYAGSADGSVVVGFSESTSGLEAFRWTSDGGMAGLGDLPGGAFDSRAKAVSADGSVIVGYSTTGPAGEAEAFVWTAEDGMRRLLDVLVEGGASNLAGWTLQVAFGVSADGTAIVGQALNPLGQSEAFLARLVPVPVPAAAWLFGSAMGVVGLMRRKRAL